MKMCSAAKTDHCKESQDPQPYENFSKHPNTKDGYQSRCRTCQNYFQKMKESLLRQNRAKKKAEKKARDT
jgi:hypothetical protein